MNPFFIVTILCCQVVPARAADAVSKPDDDARYSCHAMDSQQVVLDMKKLNEALPIKPQFEWAFRPKVTMRSPRGDAIPEWWKGDRPLWTNAVLSWFTVLEAQGNAAENSSVQIGTLRLFIYSKRGQRWIGIDQAHKPEVGLWEYPFRHVPSKGPELDRATLTKQRFKPAYPRFYHGWGNAKEIDAADIGAVFAAMEFRLALIDAYKPDDRSRAKFVVGVGADYYPDMTLRWSLDFAPGVGNGRLLLAKNSWRTATFLVTDLADQALEQKAVRALPLCDEVEN